MPDTDEGYFSLAGAQSKFTLTRITGGWAVPEGRAPSTHIVKPGVSGLAHSDLNEHLTMRVARRLGLRVARSRILRFEDQTAIVVSRFDRARTDDGQVIQLHHEDFAQATGTHPTGKHQNAGGPGISVIIRLMRAHLGRAVNDEIMRFFEATLFNWAMLGTDAHAKNYALLYPSLLMSSRRPVLAPLYDLGPALAYPEINNRRAKLAMSYDGHYLTFEIEPRHIRREAEAVGLSAERAQDRVQQLVGSMSDALGEVISGDGVTGDAATFVACSWIACASVRTH